MFFSCNAPQAKNVSVLPLVHSFPLIKIMFLQQILKNTHVCLGNFLHAHLTFSMYTTSGFWRTRRKLTSALYIQGKKHTGLGTSLNLHWIQCCQARNAARGGPFPTSLPSAVGRHTRQSVQEYSDTKECKIIFANSCFFNGHPVVGRCSPMFATYVPTTQTRIYTGRGSPNPNSNLLQCNTSY